MKAYRLKIVLLIIGTIFFTSCTSLLYTSLDVLRPAKVEFNVDANNLLVVNNSVVQPPNYGHKTILLNDKNLDVIVPADSLAIYCLSSMNEEAENREFFSSTQLLLNTVNKSNEFFKTNKLTADTIRELCRRNRSNVILSLDNIKVNDDLTEYFMAENATYLNSLEVKFETTWSLYYPNKSQVKTIVFKDTLYWETESFNRKKALSDLPKRVDALIDGALEVGRKSVNRFIPYWEKVDRYFYSSENKLLKQGIDSVYVKNWKASIDIWTSAYDNSSNALIKAYTANNIAVAYEISGDVDKALEFATKSYYSFGKASIPDYYSLFRLTDYINELNQRKREIDTLKKQLGD